MIRNISEDPSSINLNYCPELHTGSGRLIVENEVSTAVKIQTVFLTIMTPSSGKNMLFPSLGQKME